MAETEVPIVTRTFDLLRWLLPATNHFARVHRRSATQRLLHTAYAMVAESLRQAGHDACHVRD